VVLDKLLPVWHFRERHRRVTNAPSDALLAAVEEATWSDIPTMRALLRIRSAGRLPLPPRQRILDGMTAIGFTVLERTEDELVMAAVGRPWAPGGGPAPSLREEADPGRFFATFAEPGWAKVAANFRVHGGALTTETRVLLTDAPSRRAFRRYWWIIRPFSGLIRRRWLAAVIRRASRAS
jgi:hypothetical protein